MANLLQVVDQSMVETLASAGSVGGGNHIHHQRTSMEIYAVKNWQGSISISYCINNLSEENKNILSSFSAKG